ncbi:chaperonin 10-like protein [Phlyctochytrium arcticum]|nr:chaperonin 10-like protein [Phlyctochytrium arcticum]
MKEVFVLDKELRTEIRDSPIPQPADDDVLVRVITASSNPKDWKYIVLFGTAGDLNTGDDVAGYIHAVGKNVTEFKVGDRVAAFHVMGDPHGAYAEYAIAPASTTFYIPEKTSFEEACTLPLAAMTAAIALYQELYLPLPWHPRKDTDPEIPLVIYGGSTAVGAFALKLAKLSNIHPVITVAGKGQPFVESLKAADHIINYRDTKDVTAAIKAALGGKQCLHALDAVSMEETFKNTTGALSPKGKITTVLPVPEPPAGITSLLTMVGNVHKKNHGRKLKDGKPEIGRDLDFGFIMYRYFGFLLQQGRFSGHPQKVLGGLDKVEEGLKLLRDDKVSAEKLVYRVAKD